MDDMQGVDGKCEMRGEGLEFQEFTFSLGEFQVKGKVEGKRQK